MTIGRVTCTITSFEVLHRSVAGVADDGVPAVLLLDELVVAGGRPPAQISLLDVVFFFAAITPPRS